MLVLTEFAYRYRPADIDVDHSAQLIGQAKQQVRLEQLHALQHALWVRVLSKKFCEANKDVVIELTPWGVAAALKQFSVTQT